MLFHLFFIKSIKINTFYVKEEEAKAKPTKMKVTNSYLFSHRDTF